jgi:hypothetical protein
MGSFLDSNFSLDVVTESPWVTNNGDDQRVSNGQKEPTYQILRRFYGLRHGLHFCRFQVAISCNYFAHWRGDVASGVLMK